MGAYKYRNNHDTKGRVCRNRWESNIRQSSIQSRSVLRQASADRLFSRFAFELVDSIHIPSQGLSQ